MAGPENRLALKQPLKNETPNRANILWQVTEVNYPSAANCYEAVDRLLFQINDLITDPHVTDVDSWLFCEKDGIAPSVRFMFFQNPQRVYGLVYDAAFSMRAMSAGENVVAFPIGHTSELIYDRFYTAKLGSKAKVPKFPKLVITGFLKQTDAGFVLNSIFRNGWDCIEQYNAANKISGFPTEAYNTIYFLDRYSPEFREILVNKILQKYGLPETSKLKLLAFKNDD